MASPSSILASGKDFQELEDRGLLIAQAELLREIAGVTSSPSAILASGEAFQAVDERNLGIAITELVREWAP